MVELLRENQITGWSTYPVEGHGRKGEFLPGYHGFAVTGRRCRRHSAPSLRLTKPPIVPGAKPREVLKGLYFHPEDWDGSDFFLIDNSIIVTERVYRLFQKAKIRNVRFIPLPEVELSVAALKILGRLEE